jgi:DNA-binding CsgD family transcriptional regulator
LLLALDMLDLGIVVIDRDDRIAFANRAAEVLFRLRRRPHIGSDPIDQRQTLARLDRQIRAVIGRGRSRAEGRIATTNFGGRLLFFQAVRCGAASDAMDILFVSESPQNPLQDLSPVASCYGLTRAETRLLQAMVNGDTLGLYAKRTSITLNTVKGYLKQLFRKTSTARQSELLRLIVANPILHLVFAARRSGASTTSDRAEASTPKPL